MDDAERKQIRPILEHLSSESLRITDQQQKEMHADHSAKKVLQSGATIKAAVRIVEEQASNFVEKAVDDVAAVAQDPDAFVLIKSSLTRAFRGYEPHLAEAVRLAVAGEIDQFRSVEVAGEKLFAEMRDRIFKQLELHRFSFTKPSGDGFGARGTSSTKGVGGLSNTSKKQNLGGKPLAEHWDTMWAAIAVQLWNGDLKPKTQAEVKAAMFSWFNANEIEIGDTAVTQRARKLWQAMHDTD